MRLAGKHKLVMEEETAVFILVNFADIVLTALTFSYAGSEMNPVANLVIGRFGMVGLAAYKFALVTFVIMICQVVYWSHPRTARAVLIFGSVCYGLLAAAEATQLILHVYRS
jgi:hypothetical protein